MKYICYSFIVGIPLFVCTPVLAATIVSSDITTSTTWSEEGSPYVIENSIQIQPNVELQIKPGVIIKLKDGLFSVLGSIQAEGTSDKPIYFTSYSDDIGGDTNGDRSTTVPKKTDSWGISLQNSSSTFSNVHFQYSNRVLQLLNSNIEINNTVTQHTNTFLMSDNSFLNVSNSSIQDGGGVNLFNNSTARISTTTIDSINSQGSLAIYNGATVTINNILISNIQSVNAISVFNNASLTISSTTISNVTNGMGVQVYNHSLLNAQGVTVSNVSGNGKAIQIFGNTDKRYLGTTTAIISNANINHGEWDGVEIYGAADISLTKSTISEFSGDGVVLWLGAKANIATSTLTKNDNGIGIYGPVETYIQGNKIVGNLSNGIANYTPNIIFAQRNWWGDSTGPYHQTLNPAGKGNAVTNNVDFSNWLTEDPDLVPTCCSNVALFPGLEASRLFMQGSIYENQLWEPNWNNDVEKLFLNKDGSSINPGIYTRDIIDEGYKFNIYKKFKLFMNGLVTDHTIQSWKDFPYDWRQDINRIVIGGSTFGDGYGNFQNINFIKEIETLASKSKTGKVTLIGHSNGGLIIKELVQQLQKQGKQNLIDKVILIAVPQLGTPTAIPGLLHGFDQGLAGGLLLTESNARSLGRNMQSAYNLLPSKSYFDKVTDPVITFNPSVGDITQFLSYGSIIDSYDGLKEFLLAKLDNRQDPNVIDTIDPIVLNESQVIQAENHHLSFDSWQFPENIQVIQIAGWGQPTIKGYTYTAKKECRAITNCKQVLDEEPLFTSDGDGTVVIPSATAINSKTYYLNLAAYNKEFAHVLTNRSHSNILEVSALQEFLKNLIFNNSNLPNLITTDKPIQKENTLQVSVHSPVSIDAYDDNGGHVGLVQKLNSDIKTVENSIPNSFYLKFGEGKYIGIPQTSSTTVTFKGEGFGTFTVKIKSLFNTDSQEIDFSDIPVTPLTNATLINSQTQSPILSLDVDGDGKEDFKVNPNNSFDPILYLQSLKKVIISLNLDPKAEKLLLKRIDVLLDSITKGKIDHANDKIEKFIYQLDTGSYKEITLLDKQELTLLLENLLNNLNI